MVRFVFKMSCKTYHSCVIFPQKESKPLMKPDDQMKPVDSNKGEKHTPLRNIFLWSGSACP